ncbi:hypothetical protein FSP39_011686 [Pinctada imbricata]|uniref:Peptidase C1A papain C-terminal domain-containing protein n=1 Tax=Pinctada imbricata TaxID=66713 RepID=A0AA88YMF3_PINIB|nr:hypothetical protein FSP39_011686 [Pinctada imbricata]
MIYMYACTGANPGEWGILVGSGEWEFTQDNLRRQRFLNRTTNVHYGPTKFSDLSQKEFEEIYLMDLFVNRQPLLKDNKTPLQRIKTLNIPPKLDWRFINKTSNKYVSPVKNQNRCGGCWAFSSIESVETMYAYKYDTQAPELSVQEVIDCAVDNQGCAGGDTCLALDWTVKYQPIIVSDTDYPLTDTSDYCKLLTNTSRGIYVSNYTCNAYVAQEEKMLLLLYHHGPLTVAVDASTWNHYLGGIIQYHCEQYNNHAVQIVGYDLTDKYYVVIDLRYPDISDVYVFAQSLLNYVEVLLNIVTIIMHYKHSRHTIIMAFTVTVMTFWKTVLYFMMFMSFTGGRDRIGATSLPQEILLFHVPNGFWIVIPFLVMVKLWPSLTNSSEEEVVKVTRRTRRKNE